MPPPMTTALMAATPEEATALCSLLCPTDRCLVVLRYSHLDGKRKCCLRLKKDFLGGSVLGSLPFRPTRMCYTLGQPIDVAGDAL